MESVDGQLGVHVPEVDVETFKYGVLKNSINHALNN